MVYVARPVLFGLYLRLPQAWMDGLCLGLCALLLGDTVLSATILGKIRKTAERCEGDSTEALTQSVREALIRQGMLARRALHAFPYARLYKPGVRRFAMIWTAGKPACTKSLKPCATSAGMAHNPGSKQWAFQAHLYFAQKKIRFSSCNSR